MNRAALHLLPQMTGCSLIHQQVEALSPGLHLLVVNGITAKAFKQW
jgi:hypothetical protein